MGKTPVSLVFLGALPLMSALHSSFAYPESIALSAAHVPRRVPTNCRTTPAHRLEYGRHAGGQGRRLTHLAAGYTAPEQRASIMLSIPAGEPPALAIVSYLIVDYAGSLPIHP